MQDEEGEAVRLSSTELMTDLPTNLITATVEDLSRIITEATTGIDDQIIKVQAAHDADAANYVSLLCIAQKSLVM